MYSLEDKVAIITGGANGIGAYIVKEFLKEGIKYVAIIDIDEVSGTTLENNIKKEYPEHKADFFKCDVTKDDELFAVFDKVIETFGAIDVVVNNAGIVKETKNTYKKTIELNFTATVTSTLKALELMRADRNCGRGGTIINVSSMGALDLLSPSVFIYSATKAAVLHLSVCMGKKEYYQHTKVRVLTVCFGATDTDILKNMESFDEIINERFRETVAILEANAMFQTAKFAAEGLVHSYKTGESGSTWIIENGNKIMDITNKVCQAYEIMSKRDVV